MESIVLDPDCKSGELLELNRPKVVEAEDVASCCLLGTASAFWREAAGSISIIGLEDRLALLPSKSALPLTESSLSCCTDNEFDRLNTFRPVSVLVLLSLLSAASTMSVVWGLWGISCRPTAESFTVDLAPFPWPEEVRTGAGANGIPPPPSPPEGGAGGVC